jgi:hypothetical protein
VGAADVVRGGPREDGRGARGVRQLSLADGVVPLPPPARRDVGLGTAYERWAVYGLLSRWISTREVATALEGPVDGMAGIPGIHLLPLARHGARVTVLVPDAEGAAVVEEIYRTVGVQDRLDVRVSTGWPDGTFDFVLSYNGLPCVPDWRAYLAQAAARARRLLVVSVSHPASWGVLARKALRLLQPGERLPELFDHTSTKPENLEPELRKYGRIVEDSFVDCPWWPDLFVETGETLLTGTLSRLPFGARFRRGPAGAASPGDRTKPFLYGPDRFPFFGGAGWSEELAPALRRHPNLDGSRFRFLAGLLAHHRIRAVERS